MAREAEAAAPAAVGGPEASGSGGRASHERLARLSMRLGRARDDGDGAEPDRERPQRRRPPE
jgi:hypothetical protein